jgi:predicted RNase H-like nuclease
MRFAEARNGQAQACAVSSNISADCSGSIKVWSGFDTAWSPRNKGAIASICSVGKLLKLIEPEPADFLDGLEVLKTHRKNSSLHIVAIDQPLIVANLCGMRPVDRMLLNVMRKMGGAICPVNARHPLFGQDAPIKRFLQALGYTNNPIELVRRTSGNYVIEVYPVAAMPWLLPEVYNRQFLPKYNPRRKFSIEDWRMVCRAIAVKGSRLGISGVYEFCSYMANLDRPRKSDQDMVDAVVAALVAYLWWYHGTDGSLLLGDLDNGYVVVPAEKDFKRDLIYASKHLGVPVIGN